MDETQGPLIFSVYQGHSALTHSLGIFHSSEVSAQINAEFYPEIIYFFGSISCEDV